MPFNYFKVLSKDDKELIHSSFIKFLIEDEETSNYFMSALFPQFQKELNTESIELEKGYNRKRIDIEAWSEDGEHILIVENKFKSFPYKKQLDEYEAIYAHHHPNKHLTKYLLCFDPELVLFDRGDWHFIGYEEVYQVVDRFLNTDHGLFPEKEYFIRHYSEFLRGYFEQYSIRMNSCRNLYERTNDKSSKFWLRLINCIIVQKLEEEFRDRNVTIKRYDLNPGNTSVPVLNIVPDAWNQEGEAELLIQFQGRALKYYCHSGDAALVEPLFVHARESIVDSPESAKFGRLTRRQVRSCFIYKEDFFSELPENEDFGVDAVVERLLSFFDKVHPVASERFG
ncbi:MAG: PD-(D/E)XK nuclease family protein [Crocinitomicaceae bacterium]|nr:PD-(D/E)XK nuclease family protein [Crocinitomicaceae bacterium]